jgi:hypothetical protein
MRSLLLSSLALLALAACAADDPGSRSGSFVAATLPQWITGLPGDGPEFGVSGVAPGAQLPAGYAELNNAAPEAPMRRADMICTLGTQVLEQGSAPGEPAGFAVARVRCNPYRPSL